MDERKPRPRARVLWQQPLLLREEIEREYEHRDRFLKSLPELEAAFSLCVHDPAIHEVEVQPHVKDAALAFYNSVVQDGRYIETLSRNPEEAATLLGIKLDPAATEMIRSGLRLRGAHSRVNEFTVVTAIVATIALAVPEGEVVIDHSKNVQYKL